MDKDNFSDVLAIAEIMDIINKSRADIPKSVFDFFTEPLFISPQYDDLSDDEKAKVDKIVNKMMGRE